MINKYYAKYIKRDSNPNRKYAFIINGFGKIDNLSDDLYNDFSTFVNNNLDFNINEKIVFFGPSESGIFLSKYVYENSIYLNKLYIYSILRSKIIFNKYTIQFKENHCTNNNIHSFTFNYDIYNDYNTFIIIEDEITTGNTIINLINSIDKYFKKIYIFTLLDRRETENIIDLFENIEIKIFSFNLELINLYNTEKVFNYNHNININVKNIFYVIGECSEECYNIYKNTENSILRFIPATKYEIDNVNIFDIFDLGKDKNNCNYYYYNSFNINNDSTIHIFFYSTQYYVSQNFIKYLKNKNDDIKIVLYEQSFYSNEIFLDKSCNNLFDKNIISDYNLSIINNFIIKNSNILSNFFDIIKSHIIEKSSNNEIILISKFSLKPIVFLIHRLLERNLNIKIEWIQMSELDNLENILEEIYIFYPNINNFWFIENYTNKIKFSKLSNTSIGDIYIMNNINNLILNNNNYIEHILINDIDNLIQIILFLSENLFINNIESLDIFNSWKNIIEFTQNDNLEIKYKIELL